MSSTALYIRVSTDEQAEKGYSLENQEEILRRHCILNDKPYKASTLKITQLRHFNDQDGGNSFQLYNPTRRIGPISYCLPDGTKIIIRPKH